MAVILFRVVSNQTPKEWEVTRERAIVSDLRALSTWCQSVRA